MERGEKAMRKVLLILFFTGIFVFPIMPVSSWACREITFSILSDSHYYDTDLGTTGDAFEEYLTHDRKLLRESGAILEATIQSILSQPKIEFVIVPGDLTKDGELTSHQEFADYMYQLEEHGIDVFVVPGNHDVNNPHAYRYEGDQVIPVDNVSPEMFAQLYADFGYKEAISRDPNSLSYIAEPVSGLWLFALDSCKYDENLDLGAPVTGGRFTKDTLNWILEKLSEAKARGKKIVGFMHHGLLEHYLGQSYLFSEYVIEEWQTLSRILAKAGLPIVFTGHYHALDATQKKWDSGDNVISLFDVETGSLVTFPTPYRIVSLEEDNVVNIHSEVITEIDYDTGDMTFPEYAEKYLDEGLLLLAFEMLTLPPEEGGFGLDPDDPLTAEIAQQAAEGIKAHYQGDEEITSETLTEIINFLRQDDPVVRLLAGALLLLWTDLAPEDTAPTIMLDSDVPVYNRIICSTLGNNVNLSGVDYDVYKFQGTEGEAVTIRLDAFPLDAGSRKRATLILINNEGSEPPFLSDRGALPNEVTTTIPASGEYHIVIAEQPELTLGKSYVGDYFIELEASAATSQSLEPTDWVE
jgi:3',5'-cyclic AMP phosphodiesterase CpdA